MTERGVIKIINALPVTLVCTRYLTARFPIYHLNINQINLKNILMHTLSN